MGWYNDRGSEIPDREFRTALNRYDRLIDYMASQHDTMGKEETQDLYQLGVVELYATVSSCVCEHSGEYHDDKGKCTKVLLAERCLKPHIPNHDCAALCRASRICQCTNLRYLDPLSVTFEKWFKTRVAHRMQDTVSLYRPRRTERFQTTDRPFTCRVRRGLGFIDTLPLDDVTQVMNIQSGEKAYAEGIDFELGIGQRATIAWLTNGPERAHMYIVEGVQTFRDVVPRIRGKRDPRLEVAGTVWEQFGTRSAGEGFDLTHHSMSPEDQFLQKENMVRYDYFVAMLTAKLDEESLKLMDALSSDTLNEPGNGGVKQPERRLAKMLGWTRKDLDRVVGKFRASVQDVENIMKAEGRGVDNLARTFLSQSGRRL